MQKSKRLLVSLSYPLKSYAIMAILIFAILFWILFNNLSVMVLPALVLLVPWWLKYAYAVLEHSADGHAEPPPLDSDIWMWSNTRVFKQLIHAVLLFLIISSLLQLIPPVGLLVLVLALFLWPASLIIIATQNSLRMALNPIKLVLLVKYVGTSYLHILLIFTLLFASSVLFFRLENLFDLLVMVGMLYLMLLAFHSIGHIVYQKRDELGLIVSIAPEYAQQQAAEQRHQEITQALDRVYLLSEVDKPQQAWDTLLTRLPTLNNDLELNDFCFQRIRLWSKPALVLLLAQHYIALLYQQNKIAKIAQVYRQCRQLDPQFKISQAVTVIQLANYLSQQQDYAGVLSLLTDFESNYPKWTDVVPVLVLRVTCLIESAQYQAADEILQTLLLHKNHTAYPQIKAQATLLQQLNP